MELLRLAGLNLLFLDPLELRHIIETKIMNPLKDILLFLSRQRILQRFLSTSGPFRQLSRRFISSETSTECIKVTQLLNQKGILVTLDYLGEDVQDQQEAQGVVQEYLRLLDQLGGGEPFKISVSLKLSQLGLKLNDEFCWANVREIIQSAHQVNRLVTIDMEDSPYTDRILNIYQNLRQEGFRNVGTVLQSYLRRTEADLKTLLPLGPRVRLCKGAYRESSKIAFPRKKDVDRNYIKLLGMLFSKTSLEAGTYPEVATHDEKIINWTKHYVRENRIPLDKFEFQMLYGIRRDLQEKLTNQGYRMRVYVPYGTHCYPYFMRRLAERPANLIFLLKNLLYR